MLSIFKTKKEVPLTNETILVDSAKIWTVSWQSRYGEYSSNVRREFAAFLSEEEAKKFQQSIIQAFNLLRFSGSDAIGKITIEEQKQ